jgi:hypothetical protein
MSTSNKDHSVSVAAARLSALPCSICFRPLRRPLKTIQPFLTSHSPWLASVGHRRPTRAYASQVEILSAWERQQQDLDVELDRKLVICRGC